MSFITWDVNIFNYTNIVISYVWPLLTHQVEYE